MTTNKQVLTINVSSNFRKELEWVGLAMASADNRPVLNHVYCTYHNGNLKMAAADGYRYHETSLIADAGEIVTSEPVSFFIPYFTKKRLRELLSIAPTTIVVTFEGDRVKVDISTNGRDESLSKRYSTDDYEWPDTQRIIDPVLASCSQSGVFNFNIFRNDDDRHLIDRIAKSVDPELYGNSLTRISGIKLQRSTEYVLCFTAGSKENATHMQVRTNTRVNNWDTDTPEDQLTAVNPQYLNDAIQARDNLNVYISGKHKPILVINNDNFDRADRLAIVMPAMGDI